MKLGDIAVFRKARAKPVYHLDQLPPPLAAFLLLEARASASAWLGALGAAALGGAALSACAIPDVDAAEPRAQTARRDAGEQGQGTASSAADAGTPRDAAKKKTVIDFNEISVTADPPGHFFQGIILQPAHTEYGNLIKKRQRFETREEEIP